MTKQRIPDSVRNNPGESSPRHWLLVPLVAALLFLVLALHAAWVETPTVDEFAYVPAGATYWRHGNVAFFPTNPPLMKYLLALPVALDDDVQVPPVNEAALDWGPWLYGTTFQNANSEDYFQLVFRARSVVVLLTLLTGILVFEWTRRSFGIRAAAIAASLFWLCPNVLAHGHLATINAACMASIFLALFTLDWMYRRPSWVRAAFTGATLGLACSIKFVALLLPPAIIAVAAIHRLSDRERSAVARTRSLLAELGLMLLVALFVLNASAGFAGSFAPLGEYRFRSEFCKAVQLALPASLPVPLPEVYLSGFDEVKRIAERSEFGSYLLGEWRQHGWWYYNLVALGVKVPLPVLVLTAWAVVMLRKSGTAAPRLLGILLPPVGLFVLFATFSSVNLGLRHVLAVLPFLFVAIGSVFTAERFRSRPWLTRSAAAVALSSAVWITVRIHPDYLTFFNSIAGGPKGGAKWLVDSNLDWGQDLYRLGPVAKRLKGDEPIALLYFGHVDPRLYGIRYRLVPSTPVKDVVAVSVNFLRGYSYATPAPDGELVTIPGNRAAWLNAHQPVERLGSILVFDTRDSPRP